MSKNKGGAPKGNNNGAGGKQAQNSLKICLARKAGKEPVEALEHFEALIAIWDRMYDKAVAGDTAAATMIVDRIDGKPGQSIDLGPDTNVTFHLNYTPKDGD